MPMPSYASTSKGFIKSTDVPKPDKLSDEERAAAVVSVAVNARNRTEFQDLINMLDLGKDLERVRQERNL